MLFELYCLGFVVTLAFIIVHALVLQEEYFQEQMWEKVKDLPEDLRSTSVAFAVVLAAATWPYYWYDLCNKRNEDKS